MKNPHQLLGALPTPGVWMPKGFQQVYLNAYAENAGLPRPLSDEKVLHWVRRCFGSSVEKRLIHASISNQSEQFQMVVPVLGCRCSLQCLSLGEGILLGIVEEAPAERAELSLQPVLDALPVPAIVVDANRRVLFSNNRAVKHQLVRHLEAGTDKTVKLCKPLITALDQHTLAQPTRIQLTWQKRDYDIETQPIVDADLQLRFVLIRCNPKPGADWASFQATALPRLIREQLLHQFSGCYAAFKRSGDLLEVNDNCREMLSQLNLAVPLDALELQDEDWQELEEAGSMSSELRLGMQVYSIELFLVRNPELEDVLLLIGANISDRVLIERETQAYLALFRELFNAAEDGLAVLNGEDMVVREGNARFAELSGLPLGKLPGQSLDSCRHLDTRLLREQIAIARELGNKTLELNAGPEQLTHNLSVTYFESARCFLIRLSDLSAQLLLASQQREQMQIEAAAAIQAQEAERQRIAADLHDSLGQVLSVADMQLAQLLQRVEGSTFSQLEQIQKLVTMATEEVRLISANLVPTTLKDFGLPQALEELVEHMHRDEQPVMFRLQGEPRRFAHDTETALFRIAQEALHNAVKHSDARRIFILIDYSGGEFRLMVYDNGRGFSPSGDSSGRGLNNMRARASLVNAELKLESEPGEGTRVLVQL